MSAHDIATTPTVPVARRAPLLSHRRAALPVVLAGTFMVVPDFVIVNVAMPAMQADLHAGTGAIEWVVAGYGLTFAPLLISAGRSATATAGGGCSPRSASCSSPSCASHSPRSRACCRGRLRERSHKRAARSPGPCRFRFSRTLS
jgi:hypothetical protein